VRLKSDWKRLEIVNLQFVHKIEDVIPKFLKENNLIHADIAMELKLAKKIAYFWVFPKLLPFLLVFWLPSSLQSSSFASSAVSSEERSDLTTTENTKER